NRRDRSLILLFYGSAIVISRDIAQEELTLGDFSAWRIECVRLRLNSEEFLIAVEWHRDHSLVARDVKGPGTIMDHPHRVATHIHLRLARLANVDFLVLYHRYVEPELFHDRLHKIVLAGV